MLCQWLAVTVFKQIIIDNGVKLIFRQILMVCWILKHLNDLSVGFDN
jgi:hypothetical protein